MQANDIVCVQDIQEQKILSDFRQLNGNGKMEAIKRVAELTEIPRYTNSIESEHIVAAHNPEVPEETPEDSDGSNGTDN